MTGLRVRPGTLVGAATAVLGVGAAIESLGSTGGPLAPALHALVACAVVAPLALARLWPVIAAVLSTIACLSGVLLATPATVAGTLALMALFWTVGHVRPLPCPALLVLPYALLLFVADGAGDRVSAVVLLALVLGAAAVGAAMRLRAETRRRQVSARSAEASLLEYAARGERARIARELHDVVAHHITMIALQADAARLATPGLPPDGAQRLTAIGDTARTALSEMRRLLGVLREDVDAEDELRRPQPGLRQLYALLDEVRDAGSVSVRLIVSGPVQPLDQGLELTAYRIVQEALTNVRRHAPGASVDVELRYCADELWVRVHDNGPGAPPSGAAAGHGLTGMRERAAMAGGTLVAGPGPTSGFLVEAVLPRKGAAA
ncbi:sensor histidine kinase [Asanoa sp. WMMD1127]|uniref:sensor histidine kinase n=1 Tax=Asanoa sp. WMMD1127 TaxID=3016107 RepID=UPI002416515C|nr:sensor histidine kinase [Asanoa sp. WMMD1127]MDG4824736.1 sensor histidine kinase [Asanoa sp. WMMD1127]